MTASDEAQDQERALLDALRERREARRVRLEVDRHATAAAAERWTGWRRRLLPIYLRRAAQRAAPRGRTLPLGVLPWDRTLDSPHWLREEPVGGVARLALKADPPTHLGWRLALDGSAAVCGWFGLLPEAWSRFADPLELTVRMVDDGGGVLAALTVRIQPGARAIDCRWVPWRLELPAGAAGRLELLTGAPLGAVDHAWLAIGAPVLDLGGRRPRRRRSRGRHGPAPSIAILMPVHDPPLALLDATLASVTAQTSDRWELCIADDGSRDAAVIARLREVAATDPRIRLHRHDTALGISAATNAALRLATAPFVATLDHDDLLEPTAIEEIGAVLAAQPSIDVLYTDNDLAAADGTTFSAALKPDWSPDLLRAVMYTLHLGVYRRALVEEIGGWRSAFDGAQDHDLVLRLSERTGHIAHLPRILAHWRAHAGSAALGELAKPLAYERGRSAVAEHLERIGVDASVEALPWAGRAHVRYVRSEPVTVALPATAPPELVAAWRARLQDGDEVRLLEGTQELDPARLVVAVEGHVVPRDAAAIDELAGLVEAGAAAAGGLVVDPEQRVVVGAVAFPEGLPLDVHGGADAGAEDRHPSLTVVSNRQAVRGVVALRAADLDRSLAGAAQLIGSTSRLADVGRRVAWSPHAIFEATAAASAALRQTSIAVLLSCDRGADRDPYWNPLRRCDVVDESYDDRIHDEGAA